MIIQDFMNNINTKLWQYSFTEMYWQGDIVSELHDALVDLYLYTVWDFSVNIFNNINDSVAKSSIYQMTNQIFDIVSINAIEWWNKIPLTYQKFNRFSNWSNTSDIVYEYTWTWNTIYLSNQFDIEVIYQDAPKEYTLANVLEQLPCPHTFNWVLKNLVLSNMLPLYLSDWLSLWERYYQKAEIQMQRLASKYGKKYWLQNIATRQADNPTNKVLKQSVVNPSSFF